MNRRVDSTSPTDFVYSFVESHKIQKNPRFPSKKRTAEFFEASGIVVGEKQTAIPVTVG